MSTGLSLLGGLVVIGAAAALTAILIIALKPLLRRYALARPNARSSHFAPTPQGAGLAVVLMPIAALLVIAAFEVMPGVFWPLQLAVALIVLALTGALDDVFPLPVALRFLIQMAAAALTLAAVPEMIRILPFLPQWLEMIGLVIGLVWFINLTNFMDGIDGITVVEMVCISTGVILIGALSQAQHGVTVSPVAVALIGGLLGFAPFNRHVASVFLGDVGSLPIGALAGWMLISIAGEGHIAAALLLPLYYLADSTVTLYRRWRRGERLHEAHRSHFYQLAVQRGFRVPEVTNRIFVLNVALILLALLSVELDSTAVDVAVLTAGAILTAALLRHFERGRDG